jgi:hypothetical protein
MVSEPVSLLRLYHLKSMVDDEERDEDVLMVVDLTVVTRSDLNEAMASTSVVDKVQDMLYKFLEGVKATTAPEKVVDLLP